MELPALLRNKSIFIISLIFFGCNGPGFPEYSSDKLVDRNEFGLRINNGLLMLDSQVYNGRLFTLYPGTKDTAEISCYLNGREHGEWKKFYPSSRLKEKRAFENGQKSGEYLVWWENGNLQRQYFFKNDEYEGTCKEWNQEGKLTKVMNYSKGHEDGSQQWWYDNGKVKANYIIKNGRRFGLLGTKNCINLSDSIFKD